MFLNLTTVRLRIALAVLLGIPVAAVSCGDSSRDAGDGRLVVAITTDMEVPRDISRVVVDVWRGEQPESGQLLHHAELSGDDLLLPATLPVDVDAGSAVPVFARVSAWQQAGDSAVLRVVSDRQTTVPAEKQVVLEVPLQWLCDGFGGGDPGGISTACPAGQTCVAGSCESNWVDPASLPPYQEGLLDSQTSCFEAVSCFAGAEIDPSLDLESCSVAAPSTVDVGINVALAVTSETGACESDQCWIVLDGFSRSGWAKQDDRLVLPPAACDRVRTQQASGVAVTTECPTKTWSLPICPFRTDDSGANPPGSGEDAGPPECRESQHLCAGVCVENTSPATCGESCDACPEPPNGTATCDGANCGVRCDTGYHACGDTCVSDASTASCGETCTTCPEPDHASAQCSEAGCTFVCEQGYHRCGDRCVRNTSTATCGDSCTPCVAPKNATPTCDGTACDFKCSAGYHACGDECLSNSSPDSCGSECSPCPAPNHGTATCDGTSCGFDCDPGYHACGSRCRRNTSVNSCGDSCTPCPEPEHGTATCDGTSCGVACDAGRGDCNGNLSDGCETQLDTVDNCGACGTSCDACSSGTCYTDEVISKAGFGNGTEGWSLGETHWGVNETPEHVRSGNRSLRGAWVNVCGSTSRVVTTESIDLSDAIAAELRYFEKLWIADFDTAEVIVSTDGGTTWEALKSYRSLTTTWRRQTIDLSSVLGESNVRYGFRFENVCGDAYGVDWYIDDIRLNATTPR